MLGTVYKSCPTKLVCNKFYPSKGGKMNGDEGDNGDRKAEEMKTGVEKKKEGMKSSGMIRETGTRHAALALTSQ